MRDAFCDRTVQGVGYRGFVEHVAGKLGLHGYVRNCRDGRVEVFAMGTPERLGQLRIALERADDVRCGRLERGADVVDTGTSGFSRLR